jgi:hypothetical protein
LKLIEVNRIRSLGFQVGVKEGGVAVVAGPMLANKNPRLDGLSCNTFKPTMGINAGIAEINRENRTVRAKTICSPGA